MRVLRSSVLAVAAVCAVAATAQGFVVSSAVITADNHYALYNVVNGNLVFVGGNELGASGDPGTYNWSLPEQWAPFTTDGVLYIAAWSDDSVAQGLIANFTVDGQDFSTGSPAWEVIPTNQNRDDNDPYPTVAEITPLINAADASNTWVSAYEDGVNGVQPWDVVPGIDLNARWIWWDNGAPDPLRPGTGSGEYLIFRLTIPSPASAGLLALGGLLLARRRRG